MSLQIKHLIFALVFICLKFSVIYIKLSFTVIHMSSQNEINKRINFIEIHEVPNIYYN